MTDTKLRKLLEDLSRELDKTKSIDEKGVSQLRALDADIRELLERSEASADESLMKRLQDSIEDFQEQHPTLTMTLSEMLTILSNAGI